MRVAINSRYKYLTFEHHCPDAEVFEAWVMQPQFETHSIVQVPEWVDADQLQFGHFDYEEVANKFEFNAGKYNSGIDMQQRQREIRELENLLAERYQAHGRLLATSADQEKIDEVKDEIALILTELGGRYDATTT